MTKEKFIADAITWTRVGIGAALIVLGLLTGPATLQWVAWLMLADWIGDALDGTFARRSKVKIHSWIGDHDLEVDIFVSLCLAFYLWQADFLGISYVAGYLFAWLLIFLIFGSHRSLGMFFQSPIYLFLIIQALDHAPLAGWSIILTVMTMVIVTWPKFPKQILPDFFAGVQDTFRRLTR